MAPQRKDQWLDIHVIRGNVVGVNVFRGYAKLSDLALMSKADIYDKTSNPQGTQRDLSPKHAQDAYEYIKNHDIAFWPEVFLCTRNSGNATFVSGGISFSPLGETGEGFSCFALQSRYASQKHHPRSNRHKRKTSTDSVTDSRT